MSTSPFSLACAVYFVCLSRLVHNSGDPRFLGASSTVQCNYYSAFRYADGFVLFAAACVPVMYRNAGVQACAKSSCAAGAKVVSLFDTCRF